MNKILVLLAALLVCILPLAAAQTNETDDNPDSADDAIDDATDDSVDMGDNSTEDETTDDETDDLDDVPSNSTEDETTDDETDDMDDVPSNSTEDETTDDETDDMEDVPGNSTDEETTEDSDEDETEDTSDDAEESETNDSTESGNETSDEDEIEIVRYPYGAKIRMLQLKEAVLIGIAGGEEVVAFIEEKYANESVDDLNDILDKMQLVADEIDAVDYNKSSDELAQQFVDLKNESKALAKEFREKARAIIKPGDKDELAKRLKDMTREEIKGIRDEIKKAMREYNAERFDSAMKRLGKDGPEIKEKIRKGEMPAQQIAEQVRERFQNLTDDEKKQALQRIREEASKAHAYKEAALVQIRSNQFTRISEKMQWRSEEMDKIADRLQEKNLTRASERLRNISDRLEAKSDMLANRSDKLDDLADRIRREK